MIKHVRHLTSGAQCRQSRAVANPRRGQGVQGPHWDPKKGQFLEKRVNFWGKGGKKVVRPPSLRKIFQKNLKAPPLTEFWIRHCPQRKLKTKFWGLVSSVYNSRVENGFDNCPKIVVRNQLGRIGNWAYDIVSIHATTVKPMAWNSYHHNN